MSLAAHHLHDLPAETPSPLAHAAEPRAAFKALAERFLSAVFAISVIAALTVAVIGVRVAIWVPYFRF